MPATTTKKLTALQQALLDALTSETELRYINYDGNIVFAQASLNERTKDVLRFNKGTFKALREKGLIVPAKGFGRGWGSGSHTIYVRAEEYPIPTSYIRNIGDACDAASNEALYRLPENAHMTEALNNSDLCLVKTLGQYWWRAYRTAFSGPDWSVTLEYGFMGKRDRTEGYPMDKALKALLAIALPHEWTQMRRN